jgi:hypothetical protein
MIVLDVVALAPFAHERVQRAMGRRAAQRRRARAASRSHASHRSSTRVETRESVSDREARVARRKVT